MAIIFAQAGDTTVTANNPSDSLRADPSYNGSLTRIVINTGGAIDLSLISAANIQNAVIQLPKASTAYTFTPSGSFIAVMDGATQVALLPVESNLTTASLSFTDGQSELTVDAGTGAATIGVLQPDPDRTDGGSSGAPTFNIVTTDVSEGGTATFTITLTNSDPLQSYTVDYAVALAGGASAADHGDITVDGTVDNTGTGTITFAAGQSVKTITIPVVDDTLAGEAGEGISVTLSNPSGTAAINTASATSNLSDDDDPTYAFTASASSVDENGSITLTLQTTKVAQGTLVPYTITGISAADLKDGAPLTGNLTVGADGSASLVLGIAKDSLTEGAETLTIGVDGVASSQASVTINDTSLSAGTQFVLTSGLDNVAPGQTIESANIFRASQTFFNVDGVGPTLQAGDVMTGDPGRTDNTLFVTDLTSGAQNNNLPSGITLNNIQKVNLDTTANTSAAGFNTSLFSSVSELDATTQGVAGRDIFIAGNGNGGTTKTTVVIDQNGVGAAGGVTLQGGVDVTIDSRGGAGVIAGNSALAAVPDSKQIVTGVLTINQKSTGAGGVNVFGGTTVDVNVNSTSNTGAISIGNTGANTGNNTAGAIANPSGFVDVDTAGTGAVTVFGGADVLVKNTALTGGGAITVGDAAAAVASNLSSGDVTVNRSAQIAYNGLAGVGNNNTAGGAISVYGGKGVTITTNEGNVVSVGNVNATDIESVNPKGAVTLTNTGIVDAATATGAVEIAGGTNVTVTTTGANVGIGRNTNGAADSDSNPTGNVTVTQTMNGAGFGRAVTIDGGVDVTVTAKGQNVTIGGSTASGPTGKVTVTQSDVFTGNTNAVLNGTNAGNVAVNGGTDVTVTTTGGNTTVGGVVAGVNTVPSGMVKVTNSFGGVGADTVSVRGGTTVDITTTKTSGTISVGAGSTTLDAAGTSLKDAALAPTGNVTIVDKTTSGSNTAYGTGAVTVLTNGATSVSVTGGDLDAVTDIQSTLATGGSNAGKAIGTSKLQMLTIDALQDTDGLTVQSDALTELSILNTLGANTLTITNNTAAHGLKITQGGNSTSPTPVTIQVVDAKAGTVTITDNGTASTNTLRVDAAKATGVTFENTAAVAANIGGVSSDIATVTLKGAGSVNLSSSGSFGTGNLSKALTVDASAATGDVTASFQATTVADTTQSYKGGSAIDTLTINTNPSGWGNKVSIDGGNGSADVLVANYAAAGTDVALGNAASIKGFEVLRLGASADSAGGNYDASGFTTLQLGPVAGNVAFTNASSGVTLSLLSDTNKTTTVTAANATGTSDAMTVNLFNVTAATGAITAHGIEALTVNGSAGSTAGSNTATINGTPSSGAATLTIGGSQIVNLTSNSGFTSINASTNTGATVDVSAVKVSNSGTTFTGGAAKLTATGSNDATGQKALVTISGTGSTPIANGETVIVIVSDATGTNAGTYTYTNGTGNSVTAATAATSIAAAINAGATTGSTVLSNGAGNNNVAITATASGGNIVLAAAGAFELATGETATNATVTDSILGGQQQFLITADAIGGGGGNGGTIGFTFADNDADGYATSFKTAAIADGATAATVATAIATAITNEAAANKPGIASATVVDSTKVLVTVNTGQISDIKLSVDGATGGSDDAIVFAGGGLVTANAINFATVENTFVSGSGGGVYTAGLGGSWNDTAHKYSSGSETVALSASAAKADTLKLNDGGVVTDNGSKGGVTGFVVGSQTASDVLDFATAGKTILLNTASGNVVNSLNGAATMANVLDSSGALNTKLANLTYVVSNGVITFGATGGNSLSQFTVNELINAAQILVSSSTTGGANKVAAFSHNGKSYVVASDGANTLQAGTNTKSAIVELKDVSSVKGFGATFGENTIVSSTVTNLTGSAANNASKGGATIDPAALAASQTLDYTGFAKATLNVAGTAAANTNTTKMNNLASSAEVVVSATGGNVHLGLLETTQVGTSGKNSLTVTQSTNATTLDRLTVNGDAMVQLKNGGQALVVTELVDNTNTMNTLMIGTGAGATTVPKITSTALTTVNAASAGGAVTLGNGTFTNTTNFTVTEALSQTGVTFSLAGGQAATLFTSGANDVFSQSTGTGVVKMVASGASNTITLSNGANEVVANGAGTKINVGTGSNTIVATGADDVFTVASGAGSTSITVGTNASITIGTANTANVGAETIKVNAAVTGGTADSFAKTTITFASGVAAAGNIIDFSGTVDAYTLLGTTVANSQVNVGSATSLTEALNMAANHTLLVQDQGTAATTADLAANTAEVSWFQYGGDTYVVAMVNSTGAAVQQTALNADDIVVKLTGLVDLTASAFAGEALTL